MGKGEGSKGQTQEANKKEVERPDDAKKKNAPESQKELKKDKDDQDFDNL